MILFCRLWEGILFSSLFLDVWRKCTTSPLCSSSSTCGAPLRLLGECAIILLFMTYNNVTVWFFFLNVCWFARLAAKGKTASQSEMVLHEILHLEQCSSVRKKKKMSDLLWTRTEASQSVSQSVCLTGQRNFQMHFWMQMHLVLQAKRNYHSRKHKAHQHWGT